MSGAIRGVDELNDYSASTVVPVEPEAGSEHPNVVKARATGLYNEAELRAANAALTAAESIPRVSDRALCICSCGHHTDEHFDGWAACEAEGCDCNPYNGPLFRPVAAGNVAPAGVVRIPGEELLEAIESEEDIVKANRELTEGTEQNRSELGRWQRLYGEVMNECNKRLKPQGVMLLVAVPEPHGLGCVFTGVDAVRYQAAKDGGVFSPGGEDYEVTLTLPARQRVDIMATGRENFVRTMIGWVCDAVMEQKRAYLARTVH